MTYCLLPGCEKPLNPDTAKVCQSCGSKLRLKDRYRSLQPIGQGGFGRTFLAVDEDIPSQPRCVIKQLHFQDGSTENFQKAILLFHQEAARLDQLGQHPQIPSLLAHFEENQRFYLVQEWIEGQTLAQELRQNGVIGELQIWQLLQDLLPVLQYIHEQQIIHRDIKPANIMRRHSDSKLVLIDFGIAKLFAGTALLHTGTIIGSPEYMAPEQMRGKAVPASDLYSLGLTCIHLLTGVSPSNLFDMSSDRFLWRDFLPTTALGKLPDREVRLRLGQVLDKLLQTAVSDRYKSAAEVLQALDKPEKPKLAQPSPAKVLPSPPSQPAATPRVSLLAKLFQRSASRSSNDQLVSAVGIDYAKLRGFLAAKKWKEADAETKAVLCLAAGKRTGSYLSSRDIAELPCEDLQTIDRLWVKYSSGRFGFSVQKRIYEEVGEDYGSFCDRLGWPAHNPVFPAQGLNFSYKAPPGHLPSRTWSGGYHWWQHAGAMAAKLDRCGIG